MRPKTYLSVSCWLVAPVPCIIGRPCSPKRKLAACVAAMASLSCNKKIGELDISCTVQEPELTTRDGKVLLN
jgi:hypothetical protein